MEEKQEDLNYPELRSAKIMREKLAASRSLYFSVVLLVAAIITLGSASATKIEWEYGQVPSSYIAPGADNAEVMQFRIIDGDDTPIVNTTFPGDELHRFDKNSTMFLNQSSAPETGLNGFNKGEDVVRVDLIHVENSKNRINGSLLGNFSPELSFSDGGNFSDGLFNGDQGAGGNSEAVIVSNSSANSVLTDEDFVVAEGTMNFSNFSESVQFTDDTDEGYFNGSEALIRNSGENGYLNSSDEVILSGRAGLQDFDRSGPGKVRFIDHDHDGDYSLGNAIVRYSDDEGFVEENDEIVVNGTVDMEEAQDTRLSYYNNTPGNFQNTEEPIYYEGRETDHYGLVNESDIRIGSVQISVSSGLDMIVNDSLWNSSLELGKSLYNITKENTGYNTGNGTFRVLEYDNGGSTDSEFDLTDSDQEVLIYDPSNDTSPVSGQSDVSDIYIYDSDPSNNNIPDTMDFGDRFNDTQANAVQPADSTYSPDVNLTFDGSDQFYNVSKDNVTLNVSNGGKSGIVVIGPGGNAGQTGFEGDLHEGGYIRFWNASGGANGGMDGFYADMDEDGIITEGDIRIGGWNKSLDAGEVDKKDIDVGINTTGFDTARKSVKIIKRQDNPNKYYPGEGSDVGKATGGREAIIISSDSQFDSEDEFVRAGSTGQEVFNSETRFTGSEDEFKSKSAIVENTGSDTSILEDSDTVLKPGKAFMENLSGQVRYIENGTEPGFEKGSSEAILWDSNSDGVVSKGFLDKSPDKVIVSGKANLMNFTDLPASEGETGKVFIDSNRTGRYNQGEDILNITLLTNGSDSEKINGTEIFNFANTTRHNNQSTYHDGDAIINDTDDNTVYRDVFEGIEVENVYSPDNYFKKSLTPSEIVGGNIEVYEKLESGHEKVGEISDSGILQWYGSFSSEVTSNSTYYLAIDIVPSSELMDRVYGLKFESLSIDTAGSNSLTLSDCSESNFICEQRIVDNHAPEFNESFTGNSDNLNSSKTNKIYIKILEVGSGLADSFNANDFKLESSGHAVTEAEFVQGKQDILLTLNASLRTNQTPEVSLIEPGSTNEDEGQIRDLAGNLRGNDSIEAKDGLRPLIEDISYLDEDVDGTLDMLEVVFSERVNYTSFDASGWEVESRGVPCLQPLAPGNEASFCSRESGKIDVTSKGDPSLYTEPLGLESMDYVNSSIENSSMYEIGGELYNVTSSNTGYSSDGGFVVHEYGNSLSSSDGVWNPDSGDQDVLVYSVNGTELTPGDVLIYDENSTNDNVSISAGEEFTRQDIKDTTEPENSYRVDARTGFTGPGPYDPADNNVSVNVSYNSSDYSEPNSTIVSLAPKEAVPGLGASKTFNEAGNVKFWNTSGSSTDPVADGLFVDVNMTGNISHGDVRLGKWTLPDEKQLYTHEITSEVDSQTAGSSLNNTLLNLSTGNYRSLTVEDIRSVEIQNETRELNITGNVTSLDLSDNGATLNVSFNTSKYDINISDSDEVSVSYYSESDITFNHLDTVELNSMSAGGVYDGLGSLDQMNTSVVEINATALPDVTGTSGSEPVMNFTVLENLVTDQSGNTLTNTSESVTLTDRAAPAVTSASTQDADNDARIDRLELEFSENLDNASSSYDSAFNTSNGTIDAVWNRNTGDSILSLNVSEVGGTAFTPNLTVYTDSVYDASGNALDDNQSFDKVTDSANPLLMNAEIDPALSNSDFTFVDMEFSENVSGNLETEENMELDGQTVLFNYTGSSENLSVNYSQVLQTGDSPNITSVSGLADDSGNSLEKLNESNITVNTFRRQMVEGWNFISFPIASKNTPNISEVVDISNVDVVWTRMNDSWATYDPDAPVNDFDHVRGGKGYYLKASENFTLTPNVENKVEGSVTDDELDEYGTNLTNGWNLIGNTQEFNQKPGDQTAFVNVDARVDPIYGQKYGNGSKILEVDNPVKESDRTINHDLKVGEAYWADIPNGENQTYRAPIGE